MIKRCKQVIIEISVVFYFAQLLFNEAIPANPRNRTSRVCLPGPIVIENVDNKERTTDPESSWARLERLVQLRHWQLQPSITHPVVTERLLPIPNENVENPRSSINFSVLSEERLNAAVKLAKRDLRIWHREWLTKSPAKASEEVTSLLTSDEEELQVMIIWRM